MVQKMKINEFVTESFKKPERTGRPNIITPMLELAVNNNETFSIPVYTSAKTRVENSEQIQSDRVIKIMRTIAPRWSYAYHQGETLELVLVPPRLKVHFETKKLLE